MDDSRFDRYTKVVARSRISRRSSLRAGGFGLAATALAVTGLVSNRGMWSGRVLAADATLSVPATPTNTDAIEIDGMWFCNQTFALCTTAPCELDESDSSIANCYCIVENFYSIGSKSCAERAQSSSSLVSNFSTVNVNSEFSIMTCPEDAPWANCLDVPCEIDAFNPAVATCQCVMVDTGPSLTFGGGCDTSTCRSTIWSAAPTGYIGLAQFETGMKQVNQEVTLPVTCPSATPMASETSATPGA